MRQYQRGVIICIKSTRHPRRQVLVMIKYPEEKLVYGADILGRTDTCRNSGEHLGR